MKEKADDKFDKIKKAFEEREYKVSETYEGSNSFDVLKPYESNINTYENVGLILPDKKGNYSIKVKEKNELPVLGAVADELKLPLTLFEWDYNKKIKGSLKKLKKLLEGKGYTFRIGMRVGDEGQCIADC